MSSDEDGFDKTMIMTPTIKMQPPPAAVLSCVGPAPPGTSSELNLITSEITFGRGDDHDVVLKVEGVSRNHARIYPGDGTWGVQDLGSTNGIFVNKTKVEQSWLNPGDIVSIGKVHYKYGLASKKPAAPSGPPDIDISDTEKTMVIRPGAKAEAAAQSSAAGQTASKPAPAAAPTTTGAVKPAARPASSSASAASAKSSSSAGLWIVVAVVAIAIVAGAFFALT